jgi:hypothetical protein
MWMALALLCWGSAVAGNELELETKKVVVFKDGYCLVIKRAVGEADEKGELYTEEVPDAAVLGAFWAVPDKEPILSMTAGVVTTTEERSESVPCIQYLEVLKANTGKSCLVELDDRSTVRGVIRKVLTREQPQTVPPRPTLVPSAYVSPNMARRVEVGYLTGSLFVLSTGEEELLLPVTRIRRLTLKEMAVDLERTVKETRTTKRLTFRMEGGAGPRSFTLVYFRPGVRWIPTYRLGLMSAEANEKIARIALQAEILNEAEDFKGVPFDLVVGVPNFRFREVVSPFVLERTLQRTLQQAAPQIMGQMHQASNVYIGHRGSEYRDTTPQSAAELPKELTAGATQDLFVYHVSKLTLPKGHRAAVPVFEADSAYRDVYTWKVEFTHQDGRAAPSEAHVPSPLVLSKNRVWHEIELTNATKLPWTTGAAMMLEGEKPLAQELLTYTSPGGVVRIPVTVAVDVRGEAAEQEIARKLNALKWSGYTYARIDKQATLSMRNFKSRAIDLEVTCHVGGRADKAVPDAGITVGPFDRKDWKNYQGHPAVNNHSVVHWRLHLEPAADQKATVDYHYFTRH